MPLEQLTHNTVRIECDFPDGQGTGTGFFFTFAASEGRAVPVIVTNKHVVRGSTTGRISFTIRDGNGDPMVGSHRTFNIDNFEQFWVNHPDSDVDLCMMPIAQILNQSEEQGHPLFFIQLDKSVLVTDEELSTLTALEDIIMIGYPNGIWDATNNMPIVRRGVTATHPNVNYEGRREFMIDAACIQGSSGSPVFLYSTGSWTDRTGSVLVGGMRIKLLGLLYAGPQRMISGEIQIVNIPTQQRAIAVSAIPINLGLVIKASRILEMESVLLRALGLSPAA